MKENAKDLIVKSAKELFFSKGYDATTTRDIARHAQVNLGLISYYFTNKRNVLKCVNKELIIELREKVKMHLHLAENKLEEMILSILLLQAYMNEDEQVKNLIEDTIINIVDPKGPDGETQKQFKEIAKENGIYVSEEDVYRFTLTGKGVERIFIEHKRAGVINMSYLEINKTILESTIIPLGIDRDIFNNAFSICIQKIDAKLLQLLNI